MNQRGRGTRVRPVRHLWRQWYTASKPSAASQGREKAATSSKGNALIPNFTGYNTGPRHSFADRSVAHEIDVCVTLVDQPVALGVAAPERTSVNGSGRRLLEEASEHGNADTAGPEIQVLSFAPVRPAARSSRAMSRHRLKRLSGLQESRNGGGCASQKMQ